MIWLFILFQTVYPSDNLTLKSVYDKERGQIKTRFVPPSGFVRQDENGWGEYLRSLPLKPKGSSVYLYDGSVKHNQVHVAVIDMDIGNKDLQQCADAVMRLRAEYLYQNKQYDDIHFDFTNGWQCFYSKWREGYRVKVVGNKTEWVIRAEPTLSYDSFRRYLEVVFMYAGTLSLSKELNPRDILNIQIGDVFIQGGSPGHAVIVVDMVVNSTTGEKRFLLAQSYMPAQDIHVLKNPNSTDSWYSMSEVIETPEWTFRSSDLKRF